MCISRESLRQLNVCVLQGTFQTVKMFVCVAASYIVKLYVWVWQGAFQMLNCMSVIGRVPFRQLNYISVFGRVPGSRWALEQAKHNVLLHYLLVGVTEELGDFIAVLEATLPRFFKDATQLFNNGTN